MNEIEQQEEQEERKTQLEMARNAARMARQQALRAPKEAAKKTGKKVAKKATKAAIRTGIRAIIWGLSAIVGWLGLWGVVVLLFIIIIIIIIPGPLKFAIEKGMVIYEAMTPGVYKYPGETFDDATARQYLEAAGININKENCADLYHDTNCTSLDGIPKKVVLKLIEIKNNCPQCDITITGGTEVAPHQSHGPGKPIVDIRMDDARIMTADYIFNNKDTLGITKICTAPKDAKYRLNCDYNEPERHLHLEF